MSTRVENVARTSLKALVAVALLALALPAGALARKSAWQLVSLSGTYAYHATNSAPAACDPNGVSGDGTILSRDYTATFHADSFPKYQYAAKYFPFLRGPQTNGPGQKAHLVGNATSSESFRIFTVDGNGGCSAQDQTCSKPQAIKTARFMFGVTHKNFRPGGPLQTSWNISFLPQDCTPSSNDSLQGGLIPFDSSDLPSDFRAKASKRQFARKRATFSVRGTAKVKKTQGYTATVTYSAKATVKKVTIPDGCVDAHPQHTFVCSN
jgi:hypothetical protein